MRGPLLSGALGSAATLGRLAAIVREHPPAVVLSGLWIAQALAAEVPLVALVEPDKRGKARGALRRVARSGGSLLVAMAGEDLPVAPGTVGSFVVEGLGEIEDDAQAIDFLGSLLGMLGSGALVVSLDATRSPAAEARLAGLFMAAPLVAIAQERPREGALVTVGARPPDAVVSARARGRLE